MHVFEMVVLIVLIGGITSVLSKFFEGRKSRKAELFDMGMDMDEDGNPISPAVMQRLEQLEERVAVLEKIVTDRTYDLKREFEKL